MLVPVPIRRMPSERPEERVERDRRPPSIVFHAKTFTR